jgi:hypothetical protein
MTPTRALVHNAGTLIWLMLIAELCSGLKPALAAPAAWAGGDDADGGTTRVVATLERKRVSRHWE